MLALIVPATTAASGVPVARPTINNTFPAVLITSKMVLPAFLNFSFILSLFFSNSALEYSCVSVFGYFSLASVSFF